jgi:hypothetical protein
VPPDLPQTPEDWARLIAESLDPEVTALSRAIVFRRSLARTQAGRDLIAEAPSLLVEGILENTPVFEHWGPFWAWARVLLNNELTNRLRRQAKQPQAVADLTLDEDSQPKIDRGPPEQEQDPYPEQFLNRIRRWSVRQRVVLLTYCLFWDLLLWERIPPHEWDGWVQDFGLDSPFPPEDILKGVRKKRDWHRALCRALGWERVYFNGFLCRNRHLLEELA